MAPEHRAAVVAAAGTAAAHLPAVLPEAGPQCGFARGGQRVGAYPHHPEAAVGADFTVFEEEVDAEAGPAIFGGGVGEPAWSPLALGQLIQQLVELIGMRLPVAVHDRRFMMVPGG